MRNDIKNKKCSEVRAMLLLMRKHIIKSINRLRTHSKNKKGNNANKKVPNTNNANKKITSANNANKKVINTNNTNKKPSNTINGTDKIFDDILLDIENTIKSICVIQINHTSKIMHT